MVARLTGNKYELVQPSPKAWSASRSFSKFTVDETPTSKLYPPNIWVSRFNDATLLRVYDTTLSECDQFNALIGMNQNRPRDKRNRPPNAVAMCSNTSPHELKFNG